MFQSAAACASDDDAAAAAGLGAIQPLNAAFCDAVEAAIAKKGSPGLNDDRYGCMQTVRLHKQSRATKNKAWRVIAV